MWRRLFSIKWWLKRLFGAFLLFVFLDKLFPLPAEKPYSQMIFAADDQLLTAYLSKDDKWRLPSSINEVNPVLIQALLAKEDSWYYWHPGVNPVSIVRALFKNIVTGRRTSGASTITMQVARMLEPKARTILSKLQEMFRAFQLEWHHSKTEILDMYLSYLPYGGNIEGVEAASRIYFGRSPKKLSLAQAALLAVIPNRPNSLQPDVHTYEARKTRDYWLRNFLAQGVFPEKDIQAALEEPVPIQRVVMPKQAQHFCRRLGQKYAKNRLKSTLDMEIQASGEKLLQQYKQRIMSRGASNCAAIVVENSTGEVKGYWGSANFYDSEALGQIDGVQALRSPGSTLKPFVYALAFDQGRYIPQSRLLDVPTEYHGYIPRNYDGKFRGAVTLREALQQSLNIPAVTALQEVGFNDFYNFLLQTGFGSLESQRNKLGLSLVLGGCGMTLEELVTAYATFSRQGIPLKMKELRSNARKKDLQLVEKKAVLSPSAAYMVTEILFGIKRPDLPANLLAAAQKFNIAMKTGTSYGRRDAWCIGYTKSYTIGVWVGNFDGRGAPDLSGATMAVPLLVELFTAVDKIYPLATGGMKSWEKPLSLREDLFCAETGDLPGVHCKQLQRSRYIHERSILSVCTHVKPVYLSLDSSVLYCKACLPPNKYIQADYPDYPAELRMWYEANFIPYQKLPPHDTSCPARLHQPGPKIVSPTSDFEYWIDTAGAGQILLQATSDGRSGKQHWYLGDKYLGAVEAGGKLFWKAQKGEYELHCMDDLGRKSKVKVNVRYY